MVTRIKEFFCVDNQRLRTVSLVVFLLYVLFVTIPFISTPIPFLWKLTSNGGIITVVYRAIISISFFLFFLLIAVLNKFKPNFVFLAFSFLLVFSTIVGFFVLPNSVIYGDGTSFNNGYLSNNNIFHFSYSAVGLLTYLKSSSRLFFGLCFGYVLLFIMPKIL